MITYYINQNGTIIDDTDRDRLERTLAIAQLDLPIMETEDLIVDGKILTQEEYDQMQAQKERERLDLLYLTGADVERAIYKVKGLDFDDILVMVKDNPMIDEKALKIEFKANNFYRGNPYIAQVGAMLGFTADMLDMFFETKDYMWLMSKEELAPVVEETAEQEETDENLEDDTDTSSTNKPVRPRRVENES